jgi:23S rRNA pseudouridine1911/1915/1917 synthase
MIELPILFENDDYLAINKPAGLVVHPDGRTKEMTVTEWLLKKYPHLKEVGEPLTLASGEVIFRPGIVHRIDRDTSGVLIITKTQEAFEFLKAQFHDRELKKIYHAFVYGEMKSEDGTIDRPIGRSRSDFRLYSAQRGAKGEMRDALTNYKLLARTHLNGPEGEARVAEGFSYIEVAPKTGRTHQIRVHFKAINHPIVADRLYAPKRTPGLGFNRLALHARSIEFLDQNRQIIKVEAPFPPDFEAAIAEIKTL